MIQDPPAPDGVAEPSQSAVEYEALRQMMVILFDQWSDDRLEDAVTGLVSNQRTVLPIRDTDTLAFRRGSGLAARIIGGVLDGRSERYANMEMRAVPDDLPF